MKFEQKELLEETRRFQTNQFDEVEVARNTVKENLKTASLILSVSAAFIGANMNGCEVGCLQGFTNSIYIYVLLVGISIWALLPVSLRTPVEMSEENLRIYYRVYETKAALTERLINRYLVSINNNRIPVERIKRLALFSGLLLGLMILSLVAHYIPIR